MVFCRNVIWSLCMEIMSPSDFLSQVFQDYFKSLFPIIMCVWCVYVAWYMCRRKTCEVSSLCPHLHGFWASNSVHPGLVALSHLSSPQAAGFWVRYIMGIGNSSLTWLSLILLQIRNERQWCINHLNRLGKSKRRMLLIAVCKHPAKGSGR